MSCFRVRLHSPTFALVRHRNTNILLHLFFLFYIHAIFRNFHIVQPNMYFFLRLFQLSLSIIIFSYNLVNGHFIQGLSSANKSSLLSTRVGYLQYSSHISCFISSSMSVTVLLFLVFFFCILCKFLVFCNSFVIVYPSLLLLRKVTSLLHLILFR